ASWTRYSTACFLDVLCSPVFRWFCPAEQVQVLHSSPLIAVSCRLNHAPCSSPFNNDEMLTKRSAATVKAARYGTIASSNPRLGRSSENRYRLRQLRFEQSVI